MNRIVKKILLAAAVWSLITAGAGFASAAETAQESFAEGRQTGTLPDQAGTALSFEFQGMEPVCNSVSGTSKSKSGASFWEGGMLSAEDQTEQSADLPENAALISADQNQTGLFPADEVLMDQIPADQTSPDQFPSNQDVQDQIRADQIPPNPAVAEQAPADRIPADQTAPEEIPTDRISPDQGAPEQVPSDQFFSDQILTDPGVPEEALADQSPSDQTEPDQAAADPALTDPDTGERLPENALFGSPLQEALTPDNGFLPDGSSSGSEGEASLPIRLLSSGTKAAGGTKAGSDGWELSLIYFDSMNSEGLTPVSPQVPVMWHPQKLYEYRQITLQVNYRNANTVTSAQPGELHIDIPDLKLLFTGGRDTTDNILLVTIAADKKGAEELKHDWSWSTWKDPESGIPYYRLTNNRTFEERTNYEGSIQISWRLASQYGKNNVHIEACAVMNDTVKTQPFVMDYVSDEISFVTVKEAKKLNSLDRLPAGAYYWIHYVFTSTCDSGQTGIRMVIPETAWYEDEFPSDCIVLDKNMNQLTPEKGNTYRITADKLSLTYTAEKLQGECYVGYPVQTYADKSFVNLVRLYGARYQEDCCHGFSSETAFVSEAECPVAAADFAFEYSGNMYSLAKRHRDYSLSSSLMRTGEDTAWFYLYGSARYAGTQMNVQFGDDLPGLLYNTGDFHLLSPEEYRFTSVSFPEFKNLNGVRLSDPSYRYNLYVKKRGSETYELYESFQTNEARSVTFSSTDLVSAWYLELEGLKESVNVSGTDRERIQCSIAVHDPKITSTGALYNFSYMKVWIGGQEVTQADLENYATDQTKTYIGTYDLRVHGKYLYRAFDYLNFTEGENGIFGKKSMTSFVKDAAAKQFQTDITLTMKLVRTNIGSFSDSFSGYEAYDLLPAGMELRKDKKPFVQAAGTLYLQYTRKQDGSRFSGASEYSAYAQRHTTITSQENWRGTGRTMVHIVVDYSDAPMNLLNLLNGPERTDSFFRQEFPDLTVTYYAQVSFDNYLEYGARFLNSAYTGAFGMDQMAGVADNSYHPAYYVKDNGYVDKMVADLDGDGNTDELFSVSSYQVTIREAASTYQDVAVLVQTDRQNFNSRSGESTPRTAYSYKLRVRTGEERITNLVIYDILEEAFADNPHWQGTFTGIDTTWAAKAGYTVRTWYTQSTAPGTLSQNPENWSLYSPSTDHEAVKGLAFEFLDSKGAPAVVPSSSLAFVLVNMVSPEEAAGAAYNQIYTQWNALDEFGRPVYDITGIQSNTVTVTLYVPKEPVTVSLTKEIAASDVIWETGAPVFFFRLSGTTEDGQTRTFIKAAEFSPGDSAVGGKLRKTVVFKAEPGTYLAGEIQTMRYSLEGIHDIQNGERQGAEVLFRLKSGAEGSAVFSNTKTTDEGLTDTALVRNTIGS